MRFKITGRSIVEIEVEADTREEAIEIARDTPFNEWTTRLPEEVNTEVLLNNKFTIKGGSKWIEKNQ